MQNEFLGLSAGWIGGVAGVLIGILGGVFGTYCSVKNTKSPAERAFAIRASVLCWIGVAIFVLAMWLIPVPWKFGLIPVYIVGLFFSIRAWNKRQSAIRSANAQRDA